MCKESTSRKPAMERSERVVCIMYNTSRYWLAQCSIRPRRCLIAAWKTRGTGAQALLKHKHRKTINKGNVVRIARFLPLLQSVVFHGTSNLVFFFAFFIFFHFMFHSYSFSLKVAVCIVISSFVSYFQVNF